MRERVIPNEAPPQTNCRVASGVQTNGSGASKTGECTPVVRLV